MKIDKIKAIIAIAIAMIVTWGFYELSSDNANQSVAITITSFLLLSITGVVAFAAEIEDSRQSMLVKTTSITVFVLSLISCLIFSFFEFNIPFFVVVHGLLLAIYALVVLRLNKVDY